MTINNNIHRNTDVSCAGKARFGRLRFVRTNKTGSVRTNIIFDAASPKLKQFGVLPTD